MSKEKREYNIEFKIDTVRLVEEQGDQVREACENIGVPLSTMTRWLSQYRIRSAVVKRNPGKVLSITGTVNGLSFGL